MITSAKNPIRRAVTAPMAARVYAHWRSEKADGLQAELTGVRDILEAFPAIAALKQLLARTTGQASWLNIRPPLTRLSDAQAQSLLAKLETVSFQTARAA